MSIQRTARRDLAPIDSPIASPAVKPGWMDWFCEADDLYWDGEDPDCWFCGTPGRIASRPRLTSQHGFGPDLVA